MRNNNANPFEDLIPKKPSENQNTIKRYAGIAARGGLKGIGAIPDLLALPSNLGLAYSGKEPLPSVSENIGNAFDYITNNQYVPETYGEKLFSTVPEFLSGGANIAKAGATKASKFAQNYLAPQGAKQYASLAGAGAGLETGREIAPDSLAAQIGGSLLGSFAPQTLASGVQALVQPAKTSAKALNINPDKYRAFKEAGLQPTLADISDSRALKGAQNIIRETPFAEKPIKETIENTYSKILEFDKNISQEKAGNIAQLGLKNWQQRGSEIAGKLQNNLYKYIKPNSPITINKTLNKIGETQKFYTPEVRNQFNQSAVGQEYNKLLSITERTNGNIPYADLVYLRQNIDDQITNFGLLGFNKEQGQLKQLRSAIQEDIGNYFKNQSTEAGKAFERHNKFYSAFAKKNENIVNDLLKDKTVTETFKNIVTDLKVDGKKANAVIKSLSNDEKKVFSDSLISELGRNAQNDFNPASLATNFKKLEPAAQDVVLSGFSDSYKKQFRATIDAIEALKDTQKVANPSGTFNQGYKASIFYNLVQRPMSSALSLGTGRAISSKLFANEKFINWLGEASLISDPAKLEAHISKLQTISKNAPEVAPDIERYIRSLDENEEPVEIEEQVKEEVLPNEYYNEDFEEEALPVQNNPFLDLIPQQQPQSNNVQEIIKNTSLQSNLNPNLALKIAQVESNFNPVAKNPKSSASGLFQFTNGTWRDLVKRYGKEYGIELKDKNDPKANTQIATLFIKENANNLKSYLNREPTAGEIYASHVLGLNGAKRLINNYGTSKNAAYLFPRESKANKNIFYKKNRPITVEELYQFFENKMSA